jgi:hypothetical protein
MNIEHSYLLHLGFVLHTKSKYVYWFQYSFGDDQYTNVCYHIDEDHYTLNRNQIRYSFIKLISDLSFDFHNGISQESFKLFKRSETIQKIIG